MVTLLGNSKRVVADLLEEGAPRDRVRLIYNGVDVDKFSPARQRRSETRAAADYGQAFLIICVANLIPYKGHQDLIEALALCRESLPSSWYLLLVGRDDGIGSTLRSSAAQAGIADHVLFLGPRADIADLLAASDLFILASHEEGFSNAVLEAMAAGLPVIATDVGGNAEAVSDGETGYIVPAKAPARLSAAVARLALSAEQRGAFGAAGALRAKSLFSLETCVDGYDQLYRNLKSQRVD